MTSCPSCFTPFPEATTTHCGVCGFALPDPRRPPGSLPPGAIRARPVRLPAGQFGGRPSLGLSPVVAPNPVYVAQRRPAPPTRAFRLLTREIEGTISGDVHTDLSYRTSGRARALSGIGRVGVSGAIFAALLLVGMALAAEMLHALRPLVPVTVFIIGTIMVVRYLCTGRFTSGRGRGTGAVMMLPRAAGRSVAGAAGFASGRASNIGSFPVPTEIHRFRVSSASGLHTDCELSGELAGGALRRGDSVVVRGRSTRNGTLRASRVMLMTTGARVRTRGPQSLDPALMLGLVGLLCFAAVVVVVVKR